MRLCPLVQLGFKRRRSHYISKFDLPIAVSLVLYIIEVKLLEGEVKRRIVLVSESMKASVLWDGTQRTVVAANTGKLETH